MALPVCASKVFVKVSSIGEHIYIPLEDPGAYVILKQAQLKTSKPKVLKSSGLLGHVLA